MQSLNVGILWFFLSFIYLFIYLFYLGTYENKQKVDVTLANAAILSK